MGVGPKSVSQITQFVGLATNIDTLDMPAGGAQEQINVQGLRVGMLETRRGIREIEFDDEAD